MHRLVISTWGLLGLTLGCTPDRPSSTLPPPVETGTPDAGAAATPLDASAAPAVPTAPEAPGAADAGPATALGDAGAPKPGPDAATSNPSAAARAQASVFDRVLGKPSAEVGDLGKWQASLAALTGQALQEVRKGPFGVYLLVFAPTTPPRSQADQETLLATLRASGQFRYVEPDRIMKPKATAR